jgi:hypothetical protein
LLYDIPEQERGGGLELKVKVKKVEQILATRLYDD